MSNELILVYQTPEPLFALLRHTAEANGFETRLVTEMNDPIGAAAGVLPRVMGRQGGIAPAEPMLVLCGFTDERLDRFLDSLKLAGLRFPFKAVLTETNQYWLPGELFAHMAAEREAIRRRMQKQ